MKRKAEFDASDLFLGELIILLQAEQADVYGYGLEETFNDFDIKASIFYRRLGNLVKHGLVEAYTEPEGGESHQGPDRRYYAITEAGQSLLEQARALIEFAEWAELKAKAQVPQS